MAGVTGLEPITHGVEARCSTIELYSYKVSVNIIQKYIILQNCLFVFINYMRSAK